MAQNTSTKAKVSKTVDMPLDVVAGPGADPVQPVSEIIAQARAAGDSRSLAMAATLVANRPASEQDDDSRAFLATGGESVLAFDTSSTAEVATAENALADARDIANKAKAMMYAYAYGVTKVSKVMTAKALAKAWGVPAPRMSNMVWAGQQQASAQLTDATTVALHGYKNDATTGAESLGIKAKAIEPSVLAEVAADPKVTTDADFRKAVAAKARGTRKANKKAKPNAPAAQRVYNITLELDKIIRAGQIMPDGTVKDEPTLSAVENVRALATKVEEYLAHHETTTAKLAESKASVEAKVAKLRK